MTLFPPFLPSSIIFLERFLDVGSLLIKIISVIICLCLTSINMNLCAAFQTLDFVFCFLYHTFNLCGYVVVYAFCDCEKLLVGFIKHSTFYSIIKRSRFLYKCAILCVILRKLVWIKVSTFLNIIFLYKLSVFLGAVIDLHLLILDKWNLLLTVMSIKL